MADSVGETDKGALRLDLCRVGEARRVRRGARLAIQELWRQSGSGGAVNVNDIPVTGLVRWAFSPRTSSVRTHALVTGIVALSRERRCPGRVRARGPCNKAAIENWRRVSPR